MRCEKSKIQSVKCIENNSVINCHLVQGERPYDNKSESYPHTNQNLLKFDININNNGIMNTILSVEKQTIRYAILKHDRIQNSNQTVLINYYDMLCFNNLVLIIVHNIDVNHT